MYKTARIFKRPVSIVLVLYPPFDDGFTFLGCTGSAIILHMSHLLRFLITTDLDSFTVQPLGMHLVCTGILKYGILTKQKQHFTGWWPSDATGHGCARTASRTSKLCSWGSVPRATGCQQSSSRQTAVNFTGIFQPPAADPDSLNISHDSYLGFVERAHTALTPDGTGEVGSGSGQHSQGAQGLCAHSLWVFICKLKHADWMKSE